jgi:hypothetical protein
MTNSFSFEVWIYPTGPGTYPTFGGIIISKENEYEITRATDGSIQWAFANSSPGWNFINSGAITPLNQWSHVAVVYSNGIVITYLNGVLANTYNGSGSIGKAGSPNDFRIGGRSAFSQFFQGLIDEVTIYNRALTPGEISSAFEAGGAGMCEPVPYFNTSASAMKWVTNGFSMQVAGLTAHGNVLIYSSTNLISWQPIYTNPAVVGTLQFIDTNATKFPRLFYRVFQQ